MLTMAGRLAFLLSIRERAIRAFFDDIQRL
jgi:hypothetical protein